MIEEILDAREKRSLFLRDKLDDQTFIITFSLNIPGEIKTGENKKIFIQKYFYEFLKYIGKITNQISYDFFIDASGYIYYVYLSKAHHDPIEFKREALKFEESMGLSAKIIDIDVYKTFDSKISRQDLAQTPRVCFICNKYAKECAFLQTHTKKELETFVEKIINGTPPFILSEEFIFSDIIERINNGEIVEGERLKEETLAKKYNVSRTKIREVIQKLREYNLIDLKQHIGASIKILEPSEVAEMIELRIIFKSIIFKDIYDNYKEATHYILREIIKRMKTVAKDDNQLKAIWNVEFHKSIFSLSKKSYTRNLFEKIDIAFACINRKWKVAILNGEFDLIEEFIGMCEAIIGRDEERFNEIIANYFEKIKTLILNL